MDQKWRRKSYTVEIETLNETKASMYRLAAWVLDRGGKAWIIDGYESQGPDVLHITTIDLDDETIMPGQWVVYEEARGFKRVTDKELHLDYEVVQ